MAKKPKKTKKNARRMTPKGQKSQTKTQNWLLSLFTSRKGLLIFVAIFAIIGGSYALYHTFAATTKTANFEAESFRLNSHVERVSSSSASGGQAMRFRSNTSLTKSISLSQSTVRIIVRAKGQQCDGAPKALIKVDGVTLAILSVKSKLWSNYNIDRTIGPGPHTLTVGFTNNYNKYKGSTRTCTRDLDVDKVTFYSTVTNPDPDPNDDLPSPSSTGYQHTGVTLQSCEQYASGGSYIISGTSGGRVVDGCDFYNKQVRITGGGPVTLKRSRVRDNSNCDAACAAIIVTNGAGPVTIEDVEVSTTDPSVTQESQRQDRSIRVDKNNTQPVVMRRIYAHDTTRGVHLNSQNNVTIEDSYLAFNVSPPSNGNCGQERKHASAIAAGNGAHHITITNTVLGIGECSFASGLIATYPETAPNHDITIEGGLWIIQSDNSGAYGIAAGHTPPEQQNYNYTVRDVQISTQYYSDGCPTGCAGNWYQSGDPDINPVRPLGGTKIWENVTKYNPGQPDHGQAINP